MKKFICEFDGCEIGTVEAENEEEAYYLMQQKYPNHAYGLYDGVAEVYEIEGE